MKRPLDRTESKNNTQDCEEENKMEKLMNKMDNMELDMVAGGFRPNLLFRPRPRKHNANSMAANVFETQNASACVGK